MFRRRRPEPPKEEKVAKEETPVEEVKHHKEPEENLKETTSDQNPSAETPNSPPTFITEVVGDESLPKAEPTKEAPSTLASDTISVPNIPDRSEELKDALMYEEGKKSGSFLLPILFALSIILAGVAGYFYLQQSQLRADLAKMQKGITGLSNQAKADQKIIEAVAKITTIPPGEQPLIATVIDSTKLKETFPFFKDAKDDDKLLIIGKKALIYRPSESRIIVSGTFSLQASATVAETTGTPSANLSTPRVAMRNGTIINGLTKKYEPKLKKVLPEATVVRRENAKKQTYDTTIIVDISGKHRSQVKQIAADLGIEVSDLPEDESKPNDADFLFILGVDAE